jgi:Protein of unknown function (DUF1203)
MRFVPIPTDEVRRLRADGLDANGQRPERHVTTSDGYPCRHCLALIGTGKPVLVLAHRPFVTVQPYAELGPIFLCGEPCEAGGGAELPAFLTASQYILRGYSSDERIIYGTGAVVPTGEIPARAAALFDRPEVAFLHVRSATNNCFHCRIERG